MYQRNIKLSILLVVLRENKKNKWQQFGNELLPFEAICFIPLNNLRNGVLNLNQEHL